jgi:hypothetical protein
MYKVIFLSEQQLFDTTQSIQQKQNVSPVNARDKKGNVYLMIFILLFFIRDAYF